MREQGIPYSLEGYEYIGSFPFIITCPECGANAGVTATYLREIPSLAHEFFRKEPTIRHVYTRPNWPPAHANCTYVWEPI